MLAWIVLFTLHISVLSLTTVCNPARQTDNTTFLCVRIHWIHSVPPIIYPAHIHNFIPNPHIHNDIPEQTSPVYIGCNNWIHIVTTVLEAVSVSGLIRVTVLCALYPLAWRSFHTSQLNTLFKTALKEYGLSLLDKLNYFLIFRFSCIFCLLFN